MKRVEHIPKELSRRPVVFFFIVWHVLLDVWILLEHSLINLRQSQLFKLRDNHCLNLMGLECLQISLQSYLFLPIHYLLEEANGAVVVAWKIELACARYILGLQCSDKRV